MTLRVWPKQTEELGLASWEREDWGEVEWLGVKAEHWASVQKCRA